MFSKHRGSVTVFLCIILAVLIPLSCVIIDLARISCAKSQARTALKVCTESMLAAYDRQLKEQYGLFSLYPQDLEAMEKEIYNLMYQNLNIDSSVDGVSEPYKFKIRNLEVIPFYNYSEPFVLQEQVAEFMKYRAPVSAVQEFYEKLKVMVGLIKEGDMIEQKITINKAMYDIRSNLVNIDCMINDVLNDFNLDEEKQLTLIEKRLSQAKNYISTIENHITEANESVDRIKEAREGFNSIYDCFIKSQETYNELLSQRWKLSNHIVQKRNKLLSFGKNDTTLDAEIANLEEQYNALDRSCNLACEEYQSYKEKIDSFKSDFDNGKEFAIISLNGALESCVNGVNEISILKEHVSRYILYHGDTLNIIDEIFPKLGNLNEKVIALKNESKEDEGNISSEVKISVDKQMESIETETFDQVKNILGSNLQKLRVWDQLITDSLKVFNNEVENLKNTSAESEKLDIKNEKEIFNGYSSNGVLASEITALANELSELNTISSMTKVYKIPDYSLNPMINETEKNGFIEWFADNYGLEASKNGEQKKDKSGLKDLRKGAKSLAGNVANQEDKAANKYEGINADPNCIEERFGKLPSIKGITHSDDAIIRIGRAIQKSQESQYRDNPLEKPVDGLTSVNEKEKNFFDYEMERMRELLIIIKDATSNNLESFMESLYMNEYIVSAFKCEASINGIEHDIGWDRPLEKTFFNQAEVEYILFGGKTASDNINATQRSLFATRMLFNLLHVYTSQEKVATALSLASVIAGWTIFGIPVVQNFILIAWAAAEAYIDIGLLLKGKSVPLIKTSGSWQLGVGGLENKLKEVLTNDVKDYVKDKADDAIDRTSEAVEDIVIGIINTYLDQAFAPFEASLNQQPGDMDESITSDVKTFLTQEGGKLINNLVFNDIDRFKSSLKKEVNTLVNSIQGRIKSYSQEQLFGFKNAIKEEMQKLIFGSPGYKTLEDNLKMLGDKLIDKGINAVESQLDNIFGAANTSEKMNITGRLIQTDYVDYLRLFLLAVPAETKALRTADLIQLNMQEVAKKYDLAIDKYKTFLFIKAEIDINTWFIPESMLKNDKPGMINIEWSQGY